MRQNVFRSAWKVAAAAMVVAGAFSGQVHAVNDVNNIWGFEGVTIPASPGNTGSVPPGAPFAADEGVGGTATAFHSTASTVWSTPVGNGTGKSLSATAWSAGDYWQFDTPRAGGTNFGVQFDQVSSTTGPRDWTFSYSTDGITFTNFANYSVQPNANPAWSGAGAVAPTGLDTYKFDLTSITALNTASNISVRMTAATPLVAAQQGSTFAAGGTDRIDNVGIFYNFDTNQPNTTSFFFPNYKIEQPVPAPVLPVAGDVVIGLNSGRQSTTLELVRGTVTNPTPNTASKPAPYSSWTNQNFSTFVKFDNLGGTLHNVHGNLLALDPGASATNGGKIYSYATQGSIPSPAPQLLSNTTAALASPIGGLSVAPGNGKIAVTATLTGKVAVYSYTAGNGLGTGSPSISLVGQSNAILATGTGFVAGSQQGTAWLNDNTVLAFSGTGKLFTVDATTPTTSNQVKDVAITPSTATGSATSTSLAYNPGISPYIYAMYSSATFVFPTYTQLANKLYIFDPANGYNDLTGGGIDFTNSANTVRDIALDASGNLIMVTNSSPGRLEYIPGITTSLGSTAADSSIDWYSDDVFQSQPGFTGLDIGFAAAGIAGDYNNDGKVNASDYVIWRKTNINGAAGYTAWRSNFGTGVPGSGSGLDGASVPEPTSALLLVIGLAAFCSRRRSA